MDPKIFLIKVTLRLKIRNLKESQNRKSLSRREKQQCSEDYRISFSVEQRECVRDP